MDLFSPEDPRPVHFMGIGGAGMSALALIARRRGVTVSGCDTDPGGAADVAALGATVVAGHDPAHVAGARAVVVTAAIPNGHPELERARILGIPVVPRKQALAELVGVGRVVGVSGTHGKTTTTVMTTEALTAAGLGPTGLAGGRVSAWGGNAKLASDALFVVEADEYDQAFLALHPEIAVVNNVEADHLECYGTVAALEQAFIEFAGRSARAIVGTDDPGAARVAARLDVPVWRFGQGDADLRIVTVDGGPQGSLARIRMPDGADLTLRLRVPGLHNVKNAIAALGVVAALGGPIGPALEALAAFDGVGRRFERLGEARGVTFVDDYAHHPSELAATLQAARQAFPGRRLVAVFQPHLYSRTDRHGEAMGRELAAADLAIVTEVYAAREAPIPGVSGRRVAQAVTATGGRALFEPALAGVVDQLNAIATSGDVVLTLGAGDVTRVGRELLAAWRAS
ncbi:MAG TPA: UDP-N-acetylmuramate--L-alanine ligase [Gemmatimonadales bacterium]|nr:UDP-N-acetylmuramate--L-alanine ligase [Gemmatimonadales bacterium]